MKRVIYISAMLFAVMAFTSVSCEGAKVPASTTGIEKAVLAPSFDLATVSNGASFNPVLIHSDFISGYNVQILSLHKIHWVIDETFYATGYKALLNKEPKEILAPPRCPGVNTITPLKRY